MVTPPGTDAASPAPQVPAPSPAQATLGVKKARRFWWALPVFGLVVLAVLAQYLNRKQPLRVLGETTSNLASLRKYTETHPNSSKSTLRVEFDDSAYDEFVKKANLDLVSGAGVYDVIMQYPMCLSSYVRNGWIVPVDEYGKYGSKLLDPSQTLMRASWLETSHYRDVAGATPRAYGYPFAANSVLLCYNKALFEDPAHVAAFQAKYPNFKLEPPATWEHFAAIAGYFAQVKNARGLCLMGQDGGWLYWEWCNVAYTMGGGVMSKTFGWESGRTIPLILTTDETIRATQFWLSLKAFNNPDLDFFQTGLQQQMDEMRNARTAMALVWSDVAYDLIYDVPGTVGLEKTLGFAPIPGGKSLLAGGFFMVSAHSAKKAEAIEFIASLFSEDTQVWLAKRGLCSPIESVYSNPDVARLPYADALHQSLKRGEYMIEAGPECQEVSDIITTQLQRIWKGEVTVENGLREAQAEVEKKRTIIYDDLAKRKPRG